MHTPVILNRFFIVSPAVRDSIAKKKVSYKSRGTAEGILACPSIFWRPGDKAFCVRRVTLEITPKRQKYFFDWQQSGPAYTLSLSFS